MSVLKNNKLMLFILVLATSYNIHAMEIEITSKSIESSFIGEQNDTFDFFGNFSAAGEIELNNIYLFRAGIAAGRLEGNAELRFFSSANISPFIKVPLDFSLLWIYHGIFEYTVHSNSIIPFATYNWRKVSLSFGYNFRFTSFFTEASEYEATPVYALDINFINNEIIRIGFIFGNFNEFYARFLTEWSYKFYANININPNWQIINSIDFMQSGGVSFTETLYGVSFIMGVRYTW